MATDYSKLKVTELKDLLKERGIPSTGLSRKQQIIDALEAQDAKVSDESAGGDAEVSGGVEAEVTGEGEKVVGESAGGGEAETGVEAEKVEAAVAEVEAAQETAEEKVDAQGAEAEVELPSESQPTVLEHDQPVSTQPSALATPRQTSLVPEDASSDTRKRKRRSPTPPLSAETINKKLKSAEEEPVKLPEDEVIEDAPVPLDGAAHEMDEAEKVLQPYGSSDDVMDVKEDVPSSDIPATSQMAASREKAPLKPPDAMDMDTVSTRAVHPATRALYIRDLIRPIQPSQLQDHLVHLADASKGTEAIDSFHLDTLRTHAFALFTSASDASRVRAKLHNTVWPEEPTRKPLWVDFVPEDKVQDWIDKELSSGTSRRDAKRWEVVYDVSDENGAVGARLMEVTSNTAGAGRQTSFSQQAPTIGVGMPNAPLGPRGTTHRASETPLPPQRSPVEARKPTPVVNNASFNVLDQRFKSTTCKPKLYYLPKGKDLANDRLDELEKQTSRDWQGGTRADFEGQLWRYTFDDGDRLVTNGPDRGNFGVPSRVRRGGYRAGDRFRGRRY